MTVGSWERIEQAVFEANAAVDGWTAKGRLFGALWEYQRDQKPNDPSRFKVAAWWIMDKRLDQAIERVRELMAESSQERE